MSEEAPSEDVLLPRAAKRVSTDTGFVASSFREWCGKVLDLDAVAGELACDVRAAIRAALCRTPRPQSFRADVAAIAESSGVDSERLGALLRQAASIAAFRTSPGGQVLAAARDKPDGSKEPGS